jgi:hypothetical protein
MADDPRPGSVRINGGPWLPCRFTLDGTSQYVDWDLSAAGGVSMPGQVAVEIAICPGVTVYGDALVGNTLVTARGSSFSASGNGGLRGAP